MAPVTSARGLAETDSSEGGAAAENQTELLKHEWHHSRGTSARRADRVHNPGRSKLKTFTRDLSQLLKVLDSNDYQNGIKTLDEINDAGGLAAVRTNLERCISASSHLAELSQEAKDAGIDSNDSI